jgi:predicted DNA-binding helix-hairpin-helix protein
MDTRDKLNLLGDAARYDDCAASISVVSAADPADRRGFSGGPEIASSAGRDLFPCISHLHTPDGQRKAMLKILQTSACQNNCYYCAFRAGRDMRRAHLTPDELALSFDLMYRAGVVEGMFLSSGVIGTHRTMDEMLATVELVRKKYGFRGYVHLKLLPGAEPAHIEQAIALADRVSANLEAPTAERLAALAPLKEMPDLLGPLRTAAAMRDRSLGRGRSRWDAGTAPAWGQARLGLSTQFVVGPAGESDRELLTTAQMLYREVRLARAYYSAFSPVRDTPLEHAPATDPTREFRLYQADWLLRYYGFDVEELPFAADGSLRHDVDPKAAWAAAHPEHFPIEVNRAPLAELLRVPGIGPGSARLITAARRRDPLRELGDLRKLGARADRAAPFVTLSGRRPPYQPRLPLID